MAELDPLWPNGDRPNCLNGDGRPVYLGGLCGDCYAGRRTATEVRAAAVDDLVARHDRDHSPDCGCLDALEG